jgi:nucleoside-diphosphate-sugar epimerase
VRVLIIGGTGFTGPHIVRELAEQGHEVIVLNLGRTETELPVSVRRIIASKSELLDHRDDFERMALDVVVHMIAVTRNDAEAFVRAFDGIAGRAIVISSVDVYRAYGRLHRTEPGPPDPLPLTEASPLRERLGPEGLAYDKTGVEAALGLAKALPVTVIRYAGVYGPHDPQARFYPYVRRIADKRPAIILAESESRFRFALSYAENAAHAVALAVTNDAATGRVYNVAELDTPTTRERAVQIGQILGWPGYVVVVPDEAAPLPRQRSPSIDLQQDYVIDSSRIRAELGYSEVVVEDEAIRRTAAWLLEHPPSMDTSRLEYLVEDRLIAEYGAGGLGAGPSTS